MTEWISNVNIPAAQLMVGMGVPLHHIPDLRRLYGQVSMLGGDAGGAGAGCERHGGRRGGLLLLGPSLPAVWPAAAATALPQDSAGSGPIDFESGTRVAPAGHVVAVRITAGALGAVRGTPAACWHAAAVPAPADLLPAGASPTPLPPLPCAATAENANDGFKPTCGSIDEISFRSTPEVRLARLLCPLRPLGLLGLLACRTSGIRAVFARPCPDSAALRKRAQCWAALTHPLLLVPSPYPPGLGLLLRQGRRRHPRVLRLPVWPPVCKGRDARGRGARHGGGPQGNQDPVGGGLREGADVDVRSAPGCAPL